MMDMVSVVVMEQISQDEWNEKNVMKENNNKGSRM